MASSTAVLVFFAIISLATSFSIQDHSLSLNANDAYEFMTSFMGTDGSRVARGTEDKYPKCCGKEEIKLSDMDREALEVCRNSTNEKEKRGADLEADFSGISCWMECFGRNKSVLDAEGYVIKEEFHGHYVQMYAETHLHDLMEKAVDTCIPAANAKAKEVGPEETNGKKCNRAIGYTVMCMKHMVETNCPNADKIDSVDCTKIRAFLKEWNKKTGLKYN